MKIKEFSTIRPGYAFRKRLVHVPDGKWKVIQPKNISPNGNIFFEDCEPILTDVSSAYQLKPEDVLVVNRGRFASAVFNFSDPGPWIVPSSILILSINNKSVLPEYVALFINSANGQRLYQRYFEKTTIPFISTNNLEKMDIPIPTLSKQRLLVDIETINRKYAELSNRKLELQRQIISHELTKNEISIKRRQ